MATLLPINKIIGQIYPFFGAALIIMAVGIAGAMVYYHITGDVVIHEIAFSDFKNFHHNPESNMLFPMMFIVISCGAISGFHATQSPMMARCLTSEKQGRTAFYGAMIAEGIVALIWATVAMNFFGGVDQLNHVLTSPISEVNATIADPAWVVNEICVKWLGTFGAIVAIIGVVACPITTGDTAFRSSRLIIADTLGINQKRMFNRLIVTLPLFTVGFILTFQLKDQFLTVWKYVGISNQILALIVLWTAAAFLVSKKKMHWIMSIPATFLTIVCVTYLVVAPLNNGGLGLSQNLGLAMGSIIGLCSLGLFIYFASKKQFNK